jgi:23S rRNA (cytosine1962-C5)-methyltransferase
MNKIILKRKREKAVIRRHPWVFSGAIQRVDGNPGFGSSVEVFSFDDVFLAKGHYSPHSQIRVRLLSWNPDENIDTDTFFQTKLTQAFGLRNLILADATTTACRLVNAENDGLPGLIIDKYNDILVCQFLSAGMQHRKQQLTKLIWDLLQPEAIYERSDADVRQKEGLQHEVGCLMGKCPQSPVLFKENGLDFLVDIKQGHKSGFYLDQRQNRQFLRRLVHRLAVFDKPIRMLNVFSYTGGFSVYGLKSGVTSVTNLDSSREATVLGRQILSINNIQQSSVEDMVCDAFEGLRELRDQKKLFEIIVLDPPKFASTQRDIKRASRGYKDINMQAMHLLAPGGYLLTFSCSGAISEDLFQKIVFGAALDVGRHIQIVGKLTQSEDHPVALTFPEGAYLKGLVCRVT